MGEAASVFVTFGADISNFMAGVQALIGGAGSVATAFEDVSSAVQAVAATSSGLGSLVSALLPLSRGAADAREALSGLGEAATNASHAAQAISAAATSIQPVTSGAETAASSLARMSEAATHAAQASATISSAATALTSVSAGAEQAATAVNGIATASQRSGAATQQAQHQTSSAFADMLQAAMDAHAALDAVRAPLGNIASGAQQAAQETKSLAETSKTLIESQTIIKDLGGAFENLWNSEKDAISGLEKMDSINAQTASGLKSTGDISGTSMEKIQELAKSIERHTGVSKESVQTGENMLLMFSNVQNRVGEGNDIFERATRSMTDMSAKMGGDTTSAAQALGGALQDPTKATEALNAAHIKLTGSQQKLITAMASSGNMLGAQKAILGDVQVAAGGAADMYGKTLAGALARLKESWEGLSGSMIVGHIPAITLAVNDAATAIFKMADAVKGGGIAQGFIEAFGPAAAAAVAGLAVAIAGPVLGATVAYTSALVAAARGVDITEVAQAALTTATQAETLAKEELAAATTAATEANEAYNTIAASTVLDEGAVLAAIEEVNAAELEMIAATGAAAAARLEMETATAAATEANEAYNAIIASTISDETALLAAIENAYAAELEMTVATEAAAEAKLELSSATAAAIEASEAYAAITLSTAADEEALIGAMEGVVASETELTVATEAAAAAKLELEAATAAAAAGEEAFAIAAGTAAGAVIAAWAPVIAVAGAVAFAAYPIIENWGYIKPAIEDVWNEATTYVSYFVSDLGERMSSAIQSVEGFAQSVGRAVQGALGLLSSISPILGASVQGMIATAQGYLNQLSSAASGAVDTVKGTGMVLAENFKSTWAPAIDSVTGMWNRYSAAGVKAHSDIGAAATQAYSGVGGGAEAAGKKAADAMAKAAAQIDGIWTKLGEDLKSTVNLDDIMNPGDNVKLYGDEIKLVEGAMKSLAEKGVTELDTGMQSLKTTLVQLKQELDISETMKRAADDTAAATVALDSYDAGNQQVILSSAALGDTFDAAGAKADVLKTFLKNLKTLGLDDTDAGMKELASQLKVLDAESDAFQGFQQITDSMAIFGTEADVVAEQIADLQMELGKLKGTGAAGAAEFARVTAALNDLKIQQAAMAPVVDSAAMVTAKLTGAYKGIEIEAHNLGASFDDTAARLATAKTALDNMGKSSDATQPGLEALRVKIFNLQTPTQNYTDATGKAQKALSDMSTGLDTMGKALGIDMGNPLVTAATNMLQFGQGAAQLLTGIQAAPEAFAAMGDSIDALIATEAEWLGMTTVATGGLNLLLAGIIAAGAVIVGLATNFDGMRDGVMKALDDLWDSFGGFFSFLGDSFHNAIAYIGAFWDALHGDIHAPDLIDTTAKAISNVGVVTDAASKSIIEASNAMSNLQDVMKSAFGSTLQSAMKNFLTGTGNMADELRDGIRDAIVDGITQALVQKTMIEGFLGNLMDSLSTDLQSGNMNAADNVIQQIGAKVPMITQQLTAMLTPIQKALNTAFNGGQSAIDSINDTETNAMNAQDFTAKTLNAGTSDGLGSATDIQARIKIVQDALTSLNAAGDVGTTTFTTYQKTLAGFQTQLAAVTAATGTGSGSSSPAQSAVDAYSAQLNQIDATLNTSDPTSAAYKNARVEAATVQGELNAAMAAAQPKLAAGGYFDQATSVTIGEAGPEAALPLTSSVFSRIGQGIMAALPSVPMGLQPSQGGLTGANSMALSGGGGPNITLQVQYFGNGKWTKDDANQLGSLMVGRLKSLGIKPG